MTSGFERRKSTRLPPTAISSPISVSVNSVSELALVNISRGGALLQSRELMRPNRSIALRIAVGGSIYVIMGRVLRSNIVGIRGGLQYHTAVAFDQEFSALGDLVAAPEAETSPVALDEGSRPPDEMLPSMNLSQAPSEDDTVYTLEVSSAADSESKESDLILLEIPPEDDFVYAPEEILVPAPESMMSDPALLQALKLNRW